MNSLLYASPVLQHINEKERRIQRIRKRQGKVLLLWSHCIQPRSHWKPESVHLRRSSKKIPQIQRLQDNPRDEHYGH